MNIVELLQTSARCNIIGTSTRIFWMDGHWNVMSIIELGKFIYMGDSEEEAVAAFIKNEES